MSTFKLYVGGFLGALAGVVSGAFGLFFLEPFFLTLGVHLANGRRGSYWRGLLSIAGISALSLLFFAGEAFLLLALAFSFESSGDNGLPFGLVIYLWGPIGVFYGLAAVPLFFEPLLSARKRFVPYGWRGVLLRLASAAVGLAGATLVAYWKGEEWLSLYGLLLALSALVALWWQLRTCVRVSLKTSTVGVTQSGAEFPSPQTG